MSLRAACGCSNTCYVLCSRAFRTSFTWIRNNNRVKIFNMPPRTPRPLKCSVGRGEATHCGLSAKYPHLKEYIPIDSCKRDIKLHLKNLKVSGKSVSSESELILLRAGHFNEQGKGMTVCPKHRDLLGLNWRPSRFCSHPLHGSRKGKCDRGVSKKISEEIMERWKKLVPVGSGKALS